jgi:hypothetical protein
MAVIQFRVLMCKRLFERPGWRVLKGLFARADLFLRGSESRSKGEAVLARTGLAPGVREFENYGLPSNKVAPALAAAACSP